METLNNMLLAVPKMATDDYVGFTFFVGCMAMMAASAFFFLSMSSFDNKWKTSILVSGLITFIAAVHYYYMRDYWATNAESPTFFRYVDWILTVPLMCVEFYLLTRIAGATKSLLWKLILASTWMLVCGYIGEAFNTDGSTSHSVMWGVLSTLGYLYILHSVWMGEVAKLADSSGSEVVKQGGQQLGHAPPTTTLQSVRNHLVQDKLHVGIQDGCLDLAVQLQGTAVTGLREDGSRWPAAVLV